MSHHKHREKAHESHPVTASAKPNASMADAPRCQATPDQIRHRAYEICQTRNGGPGNPQADWNQAERELAGGELLRTVEK